MAAVPARAEPSCIGLKFDLAAVRVRQRCTGSSCHFKLEQRIPIPHYCSRFPYVSRVQRVASCNDTIESQASFRSVVNYARCAEPRTFLEITTVKSNRKGWYQ